MTHPKPSTKKTTTRTLKTTMASSMSSWTLSLGLSTVFIGKLSTQEFLRRMLYRRLKMMATADFKVSLISQQMLMDQWNLQVDLHPLKSLSSCTMCTQMNLERKWISCKTMISFSIPLITCQLRCQRKLQIILAANFFHLLRELSKVISLSLSLSSQTYRQRFMEL